MAIRRRNRIQVRVDEKTSGALERVGLMLGGRASRALGDILYEGAAIITDAARASAPRDTGQLAAGIYAASATQDDYRPLVRLRNGQRLNAPLRFAPRPRQALAVSSVFYTRFVERGRQGGQGKSVRPRRFFQNAKRRTRKRAIAHVQQRLARSISREWGR